MGWGVQEDRRRAGCPTCPATLRRYQVPPMRCARNPRRLSVTSRAMVLAETRSGDCGPLAGKRSTGPGGRVSAAVLQLGCFEWERVRPAGGVPRESGSPRLVAGRPRPSTLPLLPLGSAKRSPGSTECPRATRSLLFSPFFKGRSRLSALLHFGTLPWPPREGKVLRVLALRKNLCPGPAPSELIP